MPSKPKYKLYTLGTLSADTDGFADDVTGTSFTLTANVAIDGLAHQVTLKNNSATDYSGQNFTFTGTNPRGLAISFTMAGPAGTATVTTTPYFLTLTSVVPATGISTDTMDIGWTANVAMPCIPFNWRGERATLDTTVSGTINYTIQYTASRIQTDTPPFDWKDSNDTDVVNATAGQTTNITDPIMASRIVVNSATATATIKYRIIQMNEDV